MPKRSITTKVGDQGCSYLFSGEKVSKNSPRLAALGDIDELVSFLGITRHYAQGGEVKSGIREIQEDLFILSGELAVSGGKINKLSRRINADRIQDIDRKLSLLQKGVTLPQGFVVPGGTLASAYLDYARALARRCERSIVYLREQKLLRNRDAVIWINRLSDYLYLLARREETRTQPVRAES
ncbi:MAG: cob(I)yrinic acid a,c-diamide adenosyltransferase [Candidatus Omnitrophota bacterium]